MNTPSQVQSESWKQHFEDLYSTENAVILPQMDPNNYNDELGRPISLPELTRSVASQQKNKAPGPDAITNEAWKIAFKALYVLYSYFDSVYQLILPGQHSYTIARCVYQPSVQGDWCQK